MRVRQPFNAFGIMYAEMMVEWSLSGLSDQFAVPMMGLFNMSMISDIHCHPWLPDHQSAEEDRDRFLRMLMRSAALVLSSELQIGRVLEDKESHHALMRVRRTAARYGHLAGTCYTELMKLFCGRCISSFGDGFFDSVRNLLKEHEEEWPVCRDGENAISLEWRWVDFANSIDLVLPRPTEEQLRQVAEDSSWWLASGDDEVQSKSRETKEMQPEDTISGELKGLALLVKDPSLSNDDIASMCGVHRSTVYRWGLLQAARQQLKDGGKSDLPIGRRDKETRDFDAWRREEDDSEE